MEFDHLFICTDDAACYANLLVESGLTEGSPNHHPGQGTANRRFFFHNGFIELLYVSDWTELQSDLVKRTGLFERLSAKGADICPFGVCFRPTANSDGAAPFPVWGYKPEYLPPHLQIDIGIAPVFEPMWFYLSFASRPTESTRDRGQPLSHPIGFKEITSVQITLPRRMELSEPAQQIAGVEGLEIFQGDEYLMKLEFDKGLKDQSFDFRPALPLLFSY